MCADNILPQTEDNGAQDIITQDNVTQDIITQDNITQDIVTHTIQVTSVKSAQEISYG